MTDPTRQQTPLASALLPDFAVEREIGRGGMGIVYRAMDVRLERLVAIKVLPESLAGVPEIRERFLREARTAAKLSHPNIIPIYRADDIHGVVFIVMAYVEGESLGDRLAARPLLGATEVIPILGDVAAALDHAHAHGIVHRDVKPENILIDRANGRAVVTDFGIARLAEAKPLTATGQVLGTVHYMSPEQISGDAVDGRSDLYSLGVVGFRALTGRLPFDNEAASAVLVAHVVKAPPKVRDVAPRVPAAVGDVIDRCLAKDPGARYQSGRELERALDSALTASQQMTNESEAEPDVLSEREAQAVWSRAAELQALTGTQPRVQPPVLLSPATTDEDRRTRTSGYAFADVRSAAVEAGIPERYVARAAAELGLTAGVPNGEGTPAIIDETARSSTWAGGPMSIVYEVRLPGEVPESELYLLVDIIRRRMSEAGQVGTIGRSISWSSSSKNRRLQISIVSRHGKTTIRIDERLGQLAGALFGGIMGGGGGGTGGLAFGIGMGTFHSLVAALGIWGGTIGTAYLIARAVYTRQARSRSAELRALIGELSDQACDLMRVLPRQPSDSR